MFDWDERYIAVQRSFVPWIERTFSLSGKTVVEFGCGTGAVGCALAHTAGRVFGVDIDSGSVGVAQERARDLGLTNVEFEHVSPDAIFSRIDHFTGIADVFCLFAVLEHMTISERIDVLRFGHRVIKDDGILLVCESPNRLLWQDYHTAQLAFFSMLPDDLALLYYDRSKRSDFVNGIATALRNGPDAARLCLTRWGRGVSFHEIEVALGDLGGVVASNYDIELLAHRHVHREELALSRFLDRSLPGLAPVFSRYYLDLIIAKRPTVIPRKFMRPWPFETFSSVDVAYTPWDMLVLQSSASILRANFPTSTAELVLGIEPSTHDQHFVIRNMHKQNCFLTLPGTPTASGTTYHTVKFERPTDHVEIQATPGCQVSFLAFEDLRS